MRITCVHDDARKISCPSSRRSVMTTTGGELVPVKAEVHDQQRGKSEGDHADGG